MPDSLYAKILLDTILILYLEQYPTGLLIAALSELLRHPAN